MFIAVNLMTKKKIKLNFLDSGKNGEAFLPSIRWKEFHFLWEVMKYSGKTSRSVVILYLSWRGCTISDKLFWLSLAFLFQEYCETPIKQSMSQPNKNLGMLEKYVILLWVTIPYAHKVFHKNWLIKIKFFHCNISMTCICIFLLVYKSIIIKTDDMSESCYVRYLNNLYNNTMRSLFLIYPFYAWRLERLLNWLWSFLTGKC